MAQDDDIIAAMESGDYQFIFIDDGGSGSHDMPREFLVPDHLLYVAVVLQPDQSWDDFHVAHAKWLQEAKYDAPGVTEIHATEIINPKRNPHGKRSPWTLEPGIYFPPHSTCCHTSARY